MNTGYKAILAEYAAWLDTLGFSDGVVYDYKFRVRDFFDWLQSRQIQCLNILTPKDVSDYHNYLQLRPNRRHKGHLLSVSHLNHNFAAVDKLLEFLYQNGMKNAPVPTSYRITPDKEERIRKIEPLTQQEIKTLYNCIPDAFPDFSFSHRQAKQYELKLAFALYYACGLRRAEGGKIRFQDIDFDKKTVFVEKGKNYKDRIIPMSEGVYRDLQDYIYNYRHTLKLKHKRLFISTTGTIDKSLKHLQSICEDESIKAKRLSLHILRHSIATHLLQNGMGIENISLFLGHSSLESTQIYTHLV
jgi:integrase/recombinase XerD